MKRRTLESRQAVVLSDWRQNHKELRVVGILLLADAETGENAGYWRGNLRKEDRTKHSTLRNSPGDGKCVKWKTI